MKKIAYIIAGMALLAVSCNKEVKPLDVKPTSGVKQTTLTGYLASYEPFLMGTGTVNTIGDDQYYKDLRQWKEDAWDERGLVTRSISYIFFADYGSMAFRFADVPDSIDVINLWGGCPKKGSLDYMEMKACQEVKGDKIVGCRITRILENQKWGLEAGIPSYMRAYYKYKADHQPELDKIQNSIEEFDPSEYESEAAAADALAALKASLSAKETDIENAAKLAGNNALRTDVNQHQTKADSTWPDEDENWPEWIVYGAGHLVNEVAEYGLNGYDLDYEPEGDPLSGTAFNTFVSYMAQYMGPMADEDYLASKFQERIYRNTWSAEVAVKAFSSLFKLGGRWTLRSDDSKFHKSDLIDEMDLSNETTAKLGYYFGGANYFEQTYPLSVMTKVNRFQNNFVVTPRFKSYKRDDMEETEITVNDEFEIPFMSRFLILGLSGEFRYLTTSWDENDEEIEEEEYDVLGSANLHVNHTKHWSSDWYVGSALYYRPDNLSDEYKDIYGGIRVNYVF